jgi:ankyrin repeat protein
MCQGRITLWIQTVAALLVVIFLTWNGTTWAGSSSKDTQLLDAVVKGNADEVKRLLDEGTKPNARGKDRVTALMEACGRLDATVQGLEGKETCTWKRKGGNLQIAKILLEKGADPNAKDRNRETPLARACRLAEPEIVSLLLDHKADPNARDRYGITPLAAACGRIKTRKTYYRITPPGRVFMTLGRNGKVEPAGDSQRAQIVRMLLEKGAKIEGKDRQGVTALLVASGYIYAREHSKGGERTVNFRANLGDPQLVRILTEHGAKPDAKQKQGITPILVASIMNNEPVLKLLLAKKSDVDVKDRSGHTPLNWAASNGKIKAARVLLAKGADLNSKDRDGMTPLIKAAREGHTALVRLLIDKGARLNSKDRTGQTALIWAALKGHAQVVDLLLEKGADASVRNNQGKSALRVARMKQRKDVMEILKNRGVTR